MNKTNLLSLTLAFSLALSPAFAAKDKDKDKNDKVQKSVGSDDDDKANKKDKKNDKHKSKKVKDIADEEDSREPGTCEYNPRSSKCDEPVVKNKMKYQERVAKRLESQLSRIGDGLADGILTKEQSEKLFEQRRAIAEKLEKFNKDNKITKAERKELEKMIGDSSVAIFTAKHADLDINERIDQIEERIANWKEKGALTEEEEAKLNKQLAALKEKQEKYGDDLTDEQRFELTREANQIKQDIREARSNDDGESFPLPVVTLEKFDAKRREINSLIGSCADSGALSDDELEDVQAEQKSILDKRKQFRAGGFSEDESDELLDLLAAANANVKLACGDKMPSETSTKTNTATSTSTVTPTSLGAQ